MKYDIFKSTLGRRITFYKTIKNTTYGLSLWINFNKPYGSYLSNNDSIIIIYFGPFMHAYMSDNINYILYGFTCFIFGIHFITARKPSK